MHQHTLFTETTGRLSRVWAPAGQEATISGNETVTQILVMVRMGWTSRVSNHYVNRAPSSKACILC